MKFITQSTLILIASLFILSFNAVAAPAPIAVGSCPGQVVAKAAVAPYSALHGLLTTAVINNLNTRLGSVNSQPSYALLLTAATALKNSIGLNGRVVITLPDGTVAVDTSKTNNTYADFQNKAINENHNTRIAILDTQIFECGLGLETRVSSSTGNTENYVARRLGNATTAATYRASYLNNNGTVRVSKF